MLKIEMNIVPAKLFELNHEDFYYLAIKKWKQL